jgi:hypothetical protein
VAQPLTPKVQDQDLRRIMDNFAAFAQHEGQGYAPLYEQLSSVIAADPQLASLLLAAPPEQRRHTLYFAALHYLILEHPDHELAAWYPTVTSDPRSDDPVDALRGFCDTFAVELRELLATRRTQTNEVGRGAVLHPAISWAFAGSRNPIRLVDLGCSAGLNLLVDRWRYDYTSGRTRGDPSSPVLVPCTLRGDQTLPASGIPPIATRSGIDLGPVDLRDPEQTRWLQACVFADQPDRFLRLSGAIDAASKSPPEVIAGDVVDRLPSVLADIVDSPGAVCLTSTWTLAYVEPDRRAHLYDLLADQGQSAAVHLITGEPPGVDIDHAPPGIPSEATIWVHTAFGPDGHRKTVLGFSHPHGSWLEWQAPPEAHA